MRASIALGIASVLISAQASALSLSGEIIQIAPPADASWEALENNDHAFFWSEGTTTLTQSLEAEMGGLPGNAVTLIPGNGTGFVTEVDGTLFYDSGNASVQSNWGGDLAAGTYDSYMLHADKQGETTQTYDGSITFDREIVGLIFKQTELCLSDPIFGAPGTTYAGCGDVRRLELEPNNGVDNWLRISADGKTLTFSTDVPHDLDNVRILTAAVPVPAAVWLFGSALGILGWTRRRKAT
ncbi:MAG: VPLPA-CTERM sorting domain-containing protein [Gammaproteobacteria bacterium]